VVVDIPLGVVNWSDDGTGSVVGRSMSMSARMVEVEWKISDRKWLVSIGEREMAVLRLLLKDDDDDVSG